MLISQPLKREAWQWGEEGYELKNFISIYSDEYSCLFNSYISLSIVHILCSKQAHEKRTSQIHKYNKGVTGR